MSAAAAPAAVRHLIVGAFTSPDGTATGLRALHNTSSKAGTISFEEGRGASLGSPSYAVAHPDGPWVYAVSETDPATVSALTLSDQGDLSLLNTVATGGSGACHLALTRDGRFLLAANYGSGSVSSFAVRDDGRLTDRVDLVEFTGSGPVAGRQDSSHAHQVVVDDEVLLVCDLGADRVHRIAIEPEHGILGEHLEPIELPAGSGPRHLVLVDDFVAVVCELSAELWFGRRADDGWEHIRTVPTSTSGAELVQPSGIVADGQRVFVANRGCDTIAVFDIGEGKEWITRITEFDCGGQWPRDLALAGGLLWVSNQHSDEIALFTISPLPPEGPAVVLTSASPACTLLIPDPGDQE